MGGWGNGHGPSRCCRLTIASPLCQAARAGLAVQGQSGPTPPTPSCFVLLAEPRDGAGVGGPIAITPKAMSLWQSHSILLRLKDSPVQRAQSGRVTLVDQHHHLLRGGACALARDGYSRDRHAVSPMKNRTYDQRQRSWIWQSEGVWGRVADSVDLWITQNCRESPLRDEQPR
jgi:hypothetical protein